MDFARFARVTLASAAAYNLLWGAAVILAPAWTLGLLGLNAEPAALMLWQCIGMIVGVYGVGYAIAARDPVRHWPIVLVGLMGKVLGPIGFAQGLLAGTLPLQMGWTIITNDLIWWAPFAVILWRAFSEHQKPAGWNGPNRDAAEVLAEVTDAQGRSAAALSMDRPTVLLFVRHAGCVFCRQALSLLARDRAEIERKGAQVAIVHTGEAAPMTAVAQKYALTDVPLIADPDGRTYRAVGLGRGTFWQLFGPRIWARGAKACVIDGHGSGALCGDGLQLGGAALLDRGRVVRTLAARSADDQVSLLSLF